MRLFLRFAMVALGAMLVTGLPLAQQSCPPGYPLTTPDSDFADAGNGTVIHIRTGLIWKRCVEGQSWSGSTCVGTADGYTWKQAFQRADDVNGGTQGWNAGQTDWRLPNQKELRSIVELGCINPTINLNQFPTTPASFFWSGSPYVSFPQLSYAWMVGFIVAFDATQERDVTHQVRLVRGGRYPCNFDALAITAPAAPVITRLTTGDGLMKIAFKPPAWNGGATITDFTATCTGNGIDHTTTGAFSPLTVTGLTNGVSYTCTVTAANAVGTSAASDGLSKVARPASIVPMLNILLD